MDNSLFSLEIIADTLFISESIKCRFPVLSFRFLNFPQIIIQHVDDIYAKKLKCQLHNLNSKEINASLRGLKNEDALYSIKKGKSCLFMSNLVTMRRQLHKSPLYVMLTDDFNVVPVLIANCTVNLDKAIDYLSERIKKNGISHPNVYSLSSTAYDLYNLMGSKVATLNLALRMLSLGGEMLAHMPEKSSAQPCIPLIDEPLVDNNIENTETFKHEQSSYIYSPTVKIPCDVGTQINYKKRNKPYDAVTIHSYLKLCDIRDDVPALLYCKQYNNDDSLEISNISSIESTNENISRLLNRNIDKHSANDNILYTLSTLVNELILFRNGKISKNNIGIADTLDLNNCILSKKPIIEHEIVSKVKSKIEVLNNNSIEKKSFKIPNKNIIPESKSEFLNRISKPKNEPLRTHNTCDTKQNINKIKHKFICGNTKTALLRIQRNKDIKKQEDKKKNLNKLRNEFKNSFISNIPLNTYKIPIPTPRHSIINEIISSLNISETSTTTTKQIYSNNLKLKTSLFPRDVHFKTPMHAFSPQLIKTSNNYLDEDIIRRIIREVLEERKLTENINQSLNSNTSFRSNTSSIIVNESIEGHLELADLDIYQQKFSDSSEAITVSDELLISENQYSIPHALDTRSFISTKSENVCLSLPTSISSSSNQTKDSISTKEYSDNFTEEISSEFDN